MAIHKLLLLPGDGIGPEVMGEVKRLIDWLNGKGIAQFETEQSLVGGAAYDAARRLPTHPRGDCWITPYGSNVGPKTIVILFGSWHL